MLYLVSTCLRLQCSVYMHLLQGGPWSSWLYICVLDIHLYFKVKFVCFAKNWYEVQNVSYCCFVLQHHRVSLDTKINDLTWHKLDCTLKYIMICLSYYLDRINHTLISCQISIPECIISVKKRSGQIGCRIHHECGCCGRSLAIRAVCRVYGAAASNSNTWNTFWRQQKLMKLR